MSLSCIFTWIKISLYLYINNLRYADDIILMAESEEELKRLLTKVKEESEKAGLKLNIQKTKIMASGPITPWQIHGETMETVTDLFSWAPKSLQMVTAAMKLKDTCSLETSMEGRENIKANLERTKVTLNFLWSPSWFSVKS